MIRCVSLFSGIGGIDLGLERAGMEIVAQSEIDPYACRVLEKHWTGRNLGDADSCRDSLSSVLDRIAREEQAGKEPVAGPILLLENVRGIRKAGLHNALADLASIGFDAEWFSVCSCRFGAPHHRERVFVIAYPNGQGEPFVSIHEKVASLPTSSGSVSWPDPPRSVGVDDGDADRVDRNRCIGNSVVVPVIEWIGRRILDSVPLR